MRPPAPAIDVRVLTSEDAASLAELLSPLLAAEPYSADIDAATVEREILAQEPPTVFTVRWQQLCPLGAWRAGQLVGFLDAAVGMDRDHLDLPDYRPLGLIRFLVLPEEQEELATAVAQALFTAVLSFWQEAGVAYIQAFHISTGYPCWHLGAGVLPGDWREQVRALTVQGFQFTERYYCLHRPLRDLLEEFVPGADLSLTHRGKSGDRFYQIYFRRTDWVAHARVVGRRVAREQDPKRIAYVTELEVHPQWRQQNIGRWLLRRLVNDAMLEGYHEMVAHITSRQHAAMNLFVQHGFEELNYRGYTLEKTLTE